MDYRILSMLITVALFGLVALLFFIPTAFMFMLSSALLPVLIGVLTVGVLRSPAGKEVKDREGDEDWYGG